MTTFERLAKRVKDDLGIELVNFRRTYAGHWLKANGNWVWSAYYAENDAHDIGSCYTATELLKSKKPLILYRSSWPFSDEIILDDN